MVLQVFFTPLLYYGSPGMTVKNPKIWRNFPSKKNGRTILLFLSDLDARSLFNISNDPDRLIHFLCAREERIQAVRRDTQ
jgi:hypothetical protein